MRYPPAITFTPGRSRVYGAVAVLITLILIVLCAVFISGTGLFSFKNGLFCFAAAAVSLWLLRDAWRKPLGRLHYAQGQWQLQLNDREVAGTCALHLDLQRYMLVSFTAQHSNNRFSIPTTQWFHLEARQIDHATRAQVWGALRRAVYAPAELADEAVAA